MSADVVSQPNGRFFASARAHYIYRTRQLQAETDHTNRAPGAKFELRQGAKPRAGFRATASQEGRAEDFDLIPAFQRRKAHDGGRERQGAAIAVHIQFYVSPAFIEEKGDLHDPENPRNRALWNTAIKFAKNEVGGVFAARMDLDEIGGGVVDVYCAPTFERQTKVRKDGTRAQPVKEISINKALANVHAKHGKRGDRTEFGALQTAWASYAATHLDPRLERGDRKSLTGRVHLETPDYKRLKERKKETAADLESLEARFLAVQASVAKAEAARRAAEQLAEQARVAKLAAEEELATKRRLQKEEEDRLDQRLRAAEVAKKEFDSESEAFKAAVIRREALLKEEQDGVEKVRKEAVAEVEELSAARKRHAAEAATIEESVRLSRRRLEAAEAKEKEVLRRETETAGRDRKLKEAEAAVAVREQSVEVREVTLDQELAKVASVLGRLKRLGDIIHANRLLGQDDARAMPGFRHELARIAQAINKVFGSGRPKGEGGPGIAD